LAFLPVFSSKQMPAQVRVGVAAFLAFLIERTLPNIGGVTNLPAFVMSVFSQIAIGAVFGFIANFVFAGIQFAGELVDTQVGF
ncbi:flagellar biosynthetic protein FliR, partial [Klebsiella pneumoniae]|nr:flagellar biosynthetic protein FliR [Klebsiella pneumoniae]